jgi:5-methylcytosine-specific restriction endonuclease McrA
MKIDATGVLRDVDGRIPPCPKCGQRWEYEIGLGKAGHHASARCKSCGHFWWLPKPGKRTKREAKHTDLVHKYSHGFCELCGIIDDKIPKGESLEAHHVDEYAAGGESTRENIWIVCTACHKLIHWRRTYLKHILPNGVANVDREERTPVNADAAELDTLENSQAERGPANEGSDSANGPKCEQYRPFDVDEF